MWRCMRDQGCHLSFARWLSNSRLLGHPSTASHISMVSQCWFSQSINFRRFKILLKVVDISFLEKSIWITRALSVLGCAFSITFVRK